MGKFHRLISLIVAIAVPTAVYCANGEIGFEFIVLGAVFGFAYWYWGPTGAPL
ncbi:MULTISPECIES: hypothetical protein [Rhizobium/Agrobacterium group]|uniref:hypothetical protein n=1 Tax=Rhizobium/Agrobacterium group TaxID=227290 RepID=UPI0015B592E1|nr:MULTISPECIES: hypothetical protein [Rhizobium/Agrobacterium group]NWJ23506.1 hypothetical protein [Rhizobium sp. RM]UXS03186.1 hypothetical protein FY156_21075 [Agrobacterium tumefaciens]